MTHHVLGFVNVKLLLLFFLCTIRFNMTAKTNQSGDGGFLSYFLNKAPLNEFRQILYKSYKMSKTKEAVCKNKKKKKGCMR